MFKEKFLIGMIHLPPLLSLEGYPGIERCIEKALSDLDSLEKAGFDGVLIENEDDKPHTEFANESQISSFTAIAWEVVKKSSIPVGVQMMLNDWKSSFSIAKTVGAKFTRLDVFVEKMTCQWCDITPNPKEIIEFKNKLYPELLLFTDIHVKYKTLLEPKTLIESAQEALGYQSNGLIISGKATGEETPITDIKRVKDAFPEAQILIGAGVNEDNIVEQLNVADGAIIGSSIKDGDSISFKKAKKIVEEKTKAEIKSNSS